MEDRHSNEVFSPTDAKRQGFQVKNVMRDDFGFEIPVESVPLPSGGRIYPIETGLHNVKQVEIKAMTAKEEDILTSRSYSKQGTTIEHLIASCAMCSYKDVKELLIGDRNALLVAIRVTGYGSEYITNVGCPKCKKNSEFNFDLGNLEIY